MSPRTQLLNSTMLVAVVLALACLAPTAMAQDVCPKDQPLVNCFASPCSVNQCTCGKNQVCLDNYCGGCKCSCQCAKGVPTVNCLVAPCASNPCGATETCVDNYCGGCNYDCIPKPTPTCAKRGDFCSIDVADSCCRGLKCAAAKHCPPNARCGTTCVKAGRRLF